MSGGMADEAQQFPLLVPAGAPRLQINREVEPERLDGHELPLTARSSPERPRRGAPVDPLTFQHR